MKNPIMACIHADSPRAADWEAVMGSREMPLKSVLPILASAPGVPRGLFYALDTQALTDGQRARLVALLARKFDVPAEEVKADLDGPHGVPILADDVSITFDARLLL